MRVGVFGYGSLVNLTSLASTLGRQPDETYYVSLEGWVRDWTVRCANNSPRGRFETTDQQIPEHVLALNIQKDELSAVNGIVFEVGDVDIVALDMRETHYDRVDVTDQIVGEHPFDIIYTYTGKTAHLVSEDDMAIIPHSYASIVEEGFRLAHPDGHTVYVKSTKPSVFNVVHTEYRQLA